MSSRAFLRGSLAALLALPFAICAAGAASPVGSSNVATADPAVPRPPGTPCVVPLFSGVSFDDFSPRTYSYAPPAHCKGPWAKVVLTADFSVNAGRQYDRTASLWLAGVNLYFGTTEEPSSTVAPSWHVERDLTDYSALLRQAGQGQAVIGNVVNATYTGVITGSAELLFYPASVWAPPPRVPDQIYPLGSDPVGSTVALDGSGDLLSRTLSLPRNVERAYLDVFAQSQNNDEFWYTCVPDAYAAQTQDCGGGNFRETEVSIDGTPAGVAPIYPWIYTGGIDPYLWRPTPGVQTLNFMPYRVDLTPFAGLLSDGSPHTVALSVAGANHYFSATATLLVYQDKRARQITGAITRNTLTAQSPPVPTIGSTLAGGASGSVTGQVSTALRRHFVIEGYADTSHGRVVSSVDATVGFSNTQQFTIDSSHYDQGIVQDTTAHSVSRSTLGGVLTGRYAQDVDYPLNLQYDQDTQADGSIDVSTTVKQGLRQHRERALFGVRLYASDIGNDIASADTLHYDASGNYTGHGGQASTQRYVFRDSLGGCYRSELSSQAGVVTADTSGKGCPGGNNRVLWFTHPDASPDNGSTVLGW